MCDKDTLESCQVKWEGREFSSFSRFAASLRHMNCCNPSRREKESPPPRACCCSRGPYYLSAQAQKATSLLMQSQGAGCLQLSLCQHFVARKAAAAERNPYLATSALRPSLPHTSFTVAVSTAMYFPWSLCFLLCCWLRDWQWQQDLEELCRQCWCWLCPYGP